MTPAALAVPAATALLGFAVGSAINHGGTCSVAATRSLVQGRDAGPAIGLALSAGVAGALCLPLAWAAGMSAHLPASYAIGWPLVGGAALLGVGAVVNGGCLLGSLARLGDGESRMLALPVGLALGFWVAGRIVHAPPAPSPNGWAPPGWGGVAIVGLFAAVALAGWLALRGRPRPTPGTWPLARAAALLGGCGALLFLIQPGWSYADLVHQRFGPMTRMAGAPGLVPALATAAGASLAAITRRGFRHRRPDPTTIARSLAGGALMAFGAALVPGGNDALLLAAVPAGTPSGLVAYSVMTGTVLLLTLAQRGAASRPAR